MVRWWASLPISWCYQSALKPAGRCRWWCFQVQDPKVFWILSSFKSRLWLVFFFVISKVHQDEWFKFLKFLWQFWNFVWLMRSEGLVRLLQWFDWVGNQGKSIYIWFNFLFLKDYVLFVFSLFLQSICVPSSRLIVSFPFQHLLNLLLLL